MPAVITEVGKDSIQVQLHSGMQIWVQEDKLRLARSKRSDMKKLLCTSAISTALLLSSGVYAAANTKTAEEVVPQLDQESQHAVAAKRISAQFLRTHYKKINLNDAFSGKLIGM